MKPTPKHNIKAKVDTNNKPAKKKKAKKLKIETKENMTITEELLLDSGALPGSKPFSV